MNKENVLNNLLNLGSKEELLKILKKVQSENQITPKSSFQEKYWSEPAKFARECIAWPKNEFLTDYQAEILDAIPTKKRVCVRAPHSAGKSTTSAIAIHWFALCRNSVTDWKCVTTAGTSRQLTKYLWPELKKWSNRLRWNLIGRNPYNSRTEFFKTMLELSTGAAFAASSDDPQLLEGAHASQLFFVLDESKSIPDGVWDALEGAWASSGVNENTEAFILSISTPGSPLGRFYDIHAKKPGLEDWWTKHVSLEEAVAAKRISPEWAAQRLRQWGYTSVYINRVEANFCQDEEDTLIPIRWVELAQERYMDSKGRSNDY